MCLSVCLHGCMCTVFAWCPGKPQGAIRFPETGVTGGCELPEMGTGKQSWVLYKLRAARVLSS